MGCSPSRGKLFSKEQQSGLQNETEDSQTSDDSVTLNIKEIQPSEDKDLIGGHVLPQAIEDLAETGKKEDTAIEKQQKNLISQAKFEFPPHMVRAHQAAYAFLTPNITKYELLLGLLDHAAQTQLSLQPMMYALALRFEEINQALEEMAEEGELMLKEHGDYLTFPSGLINPSGMPAKCITAQPSDPPLDLLQQILLHSTKKMKLVGSSVQTLGDTTLEEVVECFSSLSKLLVGKLQVKQEIEKRLRQVLVRVECAAMRKLSPEDTALNSEDSGFAGENESLTGSERRHRGSAGSGSSGSGINTCSVFNTPVGPDEDDADEYDHKLGRKRSNSSPPDPTQTLLFMCAENVKAVVTKPESILPIGRVNIATEPGRKNHWDPLTSQITAVETKKELGTHNYFGYGMRRHSSSGLEMLQERSFKSAESTVSLPRIEKINPQPLMLHSVRKLINTSSQVVDRQPVRSLAHVPTLGRIQKKGGIPPNTDNHGKDDLDLETLPPPPLEVLMDISFKSNQNGPQEISGLHFPSMNQKAGVSHRFRACVQNVDVLPNQSILRPKLRSQDIVQQVTNLGPEMNNRAEQTRCRKDTHLDHAEHFPDKAHIEVNCVKGALHQSRIGKRFESNGLYESAISTSSLPWTAPPVSRVRLPPQCHSVHRVTSHPIEKPVNLPFHPKTFTTAKAKPEDSQSISFHNARLVFCQSDSEQPKSWTSSGGRVINDKCHMKSEQPSKAITRAKKSECDTQPK
ncbi:uncharacterized protein LOC133648380 [Entelurus aequoreus]|uniref:uncharacterized protein LOC133648380 n=1 Tax=Entelurus aequoreus TaxID=161455 RepID=UPI002B1DAAE7|nr:uncharacterized protein LOC133648380 [Entelurus aequoreus]